MDERLFYYWNSLSGRSRLLDIVMIFLSNKARYMFVIVLILLWVFKQRKTTENAVISVVITLLINSLVRLFFHRPRPFIHRRIGILIPSKLDSSFPSKHTLLAFTVATAIRLHHLTLGRLMLVLSSLTGLSRVWVGHHYPSDMIGSAAIGVMTAYLVDLRRDGSTVAKATGEPSPTRK